MRIAIDYDGTYTADPPFWDAVIALGRQHGHTFVCVSQRRNTPENRADVKIPGVRVVLTSMASKVWHMANVAGEHIDVWIDDDPRACALGK